MSFNVVIFALLASLVSGQILPTAPPSCASGCSFSSIFSGTVGGEVVIPNTYVGAKINIDSAVSLTSLTISGTQNVITVTSVSPISLGSVTVGGNNSLVFGSSTNVATSLLNSYGNVTLEAQAVVSASNSTVILAGTLTLMSASRLTGFVAIAAGAVGNFGADLGSEVYILDGVAVSGSAVFGNVGLGGADIEGTVEVTGDATSIGDVFSMSTSIINVTSTGIFTIFATFYSESEVVYVAGIIYVLPYPTPTSAPTSAPTNGTNSTTAPTSAPTVVPTVAPTVAPTSNASHTTVAPTSSANVSSSSDIEEYPPGYFVQMRGNVQLAGGYVAPVVWHMQGGSAGASLSGNGYIGDSQAGVSTNFVTVSGEISIGNSPGLINVYGNWVSSAGTVFNLEIASPQSYDQLIVSGSVTLGGTLNVILLDNYQPFHLARYYFISAGYIQPHDYFATVAGTGGNAKKWTSQASYTQGIATYAGASTVAVSLVAVVVCILSVLL